MHVRRRSIKMLYVLANEVTLRKLMRVLGGIVGLLFVLGFTFMLSEKVVTSLSGISGVTTGLYFLIFAITGESSLLKGIKEIGNKLSHR